MNDTCFRVLCTRENYFDAREHCASARAFTDDTISRLPALPKLLMLLFYSLST